MLTSFNKFENRSTISISTQNYELLQPVSQILESSKEVADREVLLILIPTS